MSLVPKYEGWPLLADTATEADKLNANPVKIRLEMKLH